MIDGRTIGDGGTGPVTQRAIRLYETYVRENGEQITY
jgi:hypothetical protein